MNLHRLVEEYAGLGPHHRTGTSSDEATRRWFTDLLAEAGCAIEEESYEFERYDAGGRVTVDGNEIESIPLWHRGEGSGAADPAWTARLPPGAGRPEERLDALLPKVTGIVGVVQVSPMPDHVFGFNRPAGRGTGAPVLITAAFQGNPKAEIQAKYVPGRSANVLARKPGAGPPLVIATLLTSWFKAAGERGTSIAAAIGLAERLPGPLLVVGTTGHELQHIGLSHFIEHHGGDLEPRAVLHLGANVGALGNSRVSFTNCEGVVVRGIPLTTFPPVWLGESSEWAKLGHPLLSFRGGHPSFRTNADVPGTSTSAERMDEAFATIEAAVESLLRHAANGSRS